MVVKRRKFHKGIQLEPETSALTIDGEVKVDSADDKIKARLGGADRSVVTEDQSQTLTNKTIDANNNTVSNLAHGAEVDEPSSGVHGVTGSIVGTTDTQSLSGKSLVDNSTQIVDEGDSSKEIDFSVGGATTSTTTTIVAAQTASRSITLPDATDTLVGKATTDTLTNKTIDANNNPISNLAHGAEVDNPSSGVHGVTGSVVGTTDAQTLTNKIIEVDAVELTIQDQTDPTKKAKFVSSSITTGTTRSYTLPDEDTTVVGTDATQTLTNKTIDANNSTITNLAHGAEVDEPTSGVHGATGSIVGTTDSQTLTNKTITEVGNTLTFDATSGHDHDGTDSKKVVGTNIDSTGGVNAQVLTSNGAGASTWAAATSESVTTKTADYTILDNDGFTTILVSDTSSDRTITLPTASANTDRRIRIKNTSTDKGKVTVDGEGAELVEFLQTIDLDFKSAFIEIQCDGSAWYIIAENVTGMQKSYTPVWTGTNWTTGFALATPYRTLDGQWYLKFEGSGIVSIAVTRLTLNITGIVWGVVTDTAISGWQNNVFATTQTALARVNGTNQLDVSINVVQTGFIFSGDVHLSSKPTFVE